MSIGGNPSPEFENHMDKTVERERGTGIVQRSMGIGGFGDPSPLKSGSSSPKP